MTKRISLLLFLTCFVCLPAKAQYYFSGQGGYLQLSQDAAADKKVTPTGLSYGAGFGRRKDFFEFEALLLKASAEDEILHDGEENTLVHEQLSLILALNFYLTKKFYLRGGFGVHKIDQSLGDEVSETSELGAKKAYGMAEDEVVEGITLGLGYTLYNGKNTDFFVQLEHYNYPSVESAAWNASLGFRFYLQ